MSHTILTSHEGLYGIKHSIEALNAGKNPLDSLEIGISAVESDFKARTVGYGGAPNILGVMECDASIMEGDGLRSGAVGALKGFAHPISAARKVMEVLPHVLLVDEGATRFAKEMGLEMRDMLAPESKKSWMEWISKKIKPSDSANLEKAPLAPYLSFETRKDLSKGTVTFLLRTSDGHFFGGVSTSGWAYKYPGRLGDSPIIGAGMYVDDRYGGASCTHTGEMTIRAGTAHAVVLYMKKGATVDEACAEAMQDLRHLKGGYIGPVIIHALSAKGEPCVVSTGGDSGDSCYFWNNGAATYSEIKPKVLAAN